MSARQGRLLLTQLREVLPQWPVLQQIDHPSRRSHQNIDPLPLQALHVRVDVRTAYNSLHGVLVRSELLEDTRRLFGDLLRQLTSGREDKDGDFALSRVRRGEHVLYGRHEEPQRLSRSGLGLRENIVVGQDDGEGRRLDLV